MKIQTQIWRRNIVRMTVLSLMGGTVLVGSLAMAPRAIANLIGTPIDVEPRSSITAGSPLSIGVKLTAGSQITITSSPAGMVSYSGYANANDTVTATTSALASGTVTVYLNSGGQSISTGVPVNGGNQ